MENLIWQEVAYSDYKSIPNTFGVYGFFNQREAKFIYIGQTTNLRSRIYQHIQSNEILKNASGILIKFSLIAESLLRSTEKELIDLFKPTYNGNTKTREINSTVSQIINALDDRTYRWLSFEIKMPEADLSRKMGGKKQFTEDELSQIETRLKFKIDRK